MGEDCYCNSFDRKANYFSELSKIFEIIASSEFKDKGEIGGEEHTSILKCKKCGSYYIWNNSNVVYLDDDLVSARKYSPKTDEKGIELILKGIEGVVDESKIEDLSQLSEKLFNIEVNRMLNETKN